MSTSNDDNKQVKSPILAIVLSALLPGLGQIYNSEVTKGLLFIGLNMVINFLIKEPLAAVIEDPQNVSQHNLIVFLGYFIAAGVLWVYSVVDAKQNADRINKEAKEINNPSKGE